MAQLPAVTFPGFLRRLLLGTTALLPAAMAQAQAPNAVPTGGQVTAGQASITQSGTHTQVNQGSNRAVVDWQRFDVGRNSTVNFAQPNAQSWTLNRVNTPDPSLIAGRITANGGVAIVNQSGVVFTPGSQVNVGSLIASTANITNQNFMAGRMEFNERGRDGARVENHGSITVADRGLAALVGPGVTNTGTIRARLGTAVVAGAETFRLDLAGDGMLSLEVTDSVRRTANGNAALVTNSGVIEAQGGQVILSAHAASGLVESVVRNTGRVSGRNVTVTGQGGNVDIASGSVTARGGSVSVTAPDATVVVGPQARVSASSRQGGGQVQLGGATTSAVRVEGRVSARGTGANATGGRVAVQARDSVTVAPTAVVNASGTVAGGTVLLGTTGVGRAQTMARETRVDSGAVVRADAVANGNGGTIVINSTENTRMAGNLSARGGALSGDGGFVEVSGLNRLSLDLSKVDARAPMGRAGTLLIDPDSIIIAATGTNVGGNVNEGDPPVGGVLTLSADSIRTFAGGALVLEAVFAVTVNAAIDTTIVASAGPPPVAASTLTNLTLRTTDASGAGITIGAGITLNAGNLTLTSASGIALNQAVSANNVNLNAAGAIAGAGVVTTAGTLTVRGATGGAATSAGSLSLTGANQVATLDARTTNALFFANERGAGLTVAQARSADSSVTIAANGLISNPNAVTATTGISATNATNGFVLLRPFDTTTPTTNTAFEIANAAPAGGMTVGDLANITTPRLSLQSTGNAALTVTDAFTSPSATLELVGNTIALDATVTGDTNGQVRLFSDAGLTGAFGVTVGGTGTIEILPRTTGGNISLGGAGAFVETAQIALMNAPTLVIGGMALSRAGVAGPINTGNITITGDVTPNGTVTTLRLRAGGSVTQTGGIITAPNLSGYANGGEFTLSTGGVTPTANVITAIVADGAPGSTGIAASGNLRIDSNVALLTVNAPLRSGTRERDATTGAPLGSAVISNNTTLSLFANDLALAALVTAPSGTIQLQSFTTRRDVTLGAAGAGTLSLDATDLGNLGDALNPTTVLRLGRAHADGATHNIGSIAMDGAVNLGTRITHLELLASTDTTARSVSGTGVITVASLSAMAGGNVSLTGANLVTTLARVTDTGAGTRAGVGNVSLWSGVANGTEGVGTPGLLSFTNAANLAVDGSVIASGANNLRLEVTGTLGINASAAPTTAPYWVASEGGTVTVTATGALTNRGVIASGTLPPGSASPGTPAGGLVQGGAGSENTATGHILLGITTANAGTAPQSLVQGIATNRGVIIAGAVSGLASNEATGTIVTRARLPGTLASATDTPASAGPPVVVAQPAGGVVNSGPLSNAGSIFGSVDVTGDLTNTGSIFGNTVVSRAAIENSGTILSGAIRAQGTLTHTAGEIGAGTGTVTAGSPALDAALIRLRGITTPGAAPSAPAIAANRTGSLTVESTAGSILQSGGSFTAPTGEAVTFTARTGAVTQSGTAVITAPRIAVSADTSVTLNQTGNSFNTIIPWEAPPQLGAVDQASPIAALVLLPGGVTDAPSFVNPSAVLAGYGIAARTGAVVLQTSAPTLNVNAGAGIRAGTDISAQLNAANALLTLDAALRSGTAGGANPLLTLQADRMALNAVAGSMTLVAPGGTIRLRTESATRAINLGGTTKATSDSLDLTTDELARIGGNGALGTGLGLDGLLNANFAAARLRIGGDTAGAITVRGDVLLRNGAAGVDGAFQSRVTTLELASATSVTQNATTSISVDGIAGRAGTGEFTLHDRAAHGTASLNAMDRIVAGTLDGTLTTNGAARNNLTAGTDIAITTRRSLTVATPVIAGQDAILRVAPATNDGVLTVNSAITVGSTRALALVADSMDIGANLVAPNGSIRVMPFTAGRNVTLGGEVAGTLSLSNTELAFFGTGGTAATVLRIGRVSPAADAGALYTALNANTVGNINVAGAVDLRTRLAALELFANSQSGGISGAGAINVSSLAGIAGGAISLTGGNTVDTLAGITDAGSFANTTPAYVIAAPFLNNDGAILTRSISNTALWAGAGNAQAGGPVASGLTFNNVGNLVVDGSVLNSGAGNLALTTTAGSNGNITVNATRWIAAENGTVTVTAGGSGILDNSGTIISASLSGGSVTSGGAGINRSIGTIALGNPAGAVTSEIGNIQTNEAGGFLFAKAITGLTSNSGLILTGTVGSGTLGTTTIGGLTSLGAVNNTGTIVGNVQVQSLINSGTILGDTVVATGGNIDNSGRIVTQAIRASGDVTNSGDIVAGTGSAEVGFLVDAAIVRVGAITPGPIPAPTIATTEFRSGDLSIQAGGSIIQTAGTITAGNSLPIAGSNAATDGATVRSITLTAGIAGYGNNDILQTGGVIRRTDNTVGNLQLAASAGREIRLSQSGNTFNEIIAWQAQAFAGPPALAATAAALPGLTGTPVMTGYGIGAGGDVTLRTSAATLTVTAGIRAGGGNHTTQRHPTDIALAEVPVTPTSLSLQLGTTNALLTVNAALRSEPGSAGPSLLTLQADRMAINTAAGSMTVVAPNGTIRLRTQSANRAINLGGISVDTVGPPLVLADPDGSLNLGADELTRIGGLGADGLTTPAARLRIGDDAAGAITVGGDVLLRNGAAGVDGTFDSRVTTLELVSATSVTQNATTSISVDGIAGRAGTGEFRLVDQTLVEQDTRGAISRNAIDRIVGGTLDGSSLIAVGGPRDELRAGTDIAITTRRNLTVATPVIAGQDAVLRVAPGASTNGLLTVNAPITVGNTRLLTLQADRMALNAVAGSMTLVAPGGTIRLRTENTNRAINLGGDATDPAGSLDLGADELTRIGGLGADGLTTPAARLRIGDDAAGAITVRGDVLLRNGAAGVDGAFQSRVTTLELVSATSVTQNATTSISVDGIAGRAGTGEFTLHDRAAHGTASLNAIDQIVGGTLDGTLTTNGAARNNLTAGTDIAITTRRSLTVATPVIAGQDAILRVAPATNDGVLTVNSAITVGSTRALALVADSMDIGANLVAPNGSIRVMPFTAGRNVTLGGEVAGTLSLSNTELAFFGTGGTAATVLRIGRVSPAADAGALYTALNANTVGNINVAGAVDLRTRLAALELFANSQSGGIAGTGAINVSSLAGIAGGAISLTGGNTVDTLAGITDAGSFANTTPAYVIAAPFLDNAGAILTRSIGNTALWAGAGNAQAGGPVASGLTFNNVGNLVVDGSVLNSGAGNLALTTTAGSNGNITVNATRWIAAENGTVTVTAGGSGILDNSGTIISASLSGGSVTSGGAGINRAGAVIALGSPSGASSISGIATNSGLLYAKDVSGLTTNNAAGRVWTQRDGSTDLGTIGMTAGASNAGILVGEVTGAADFTNQANAWVVGSLSAGSVTNAADGRIAASFVRATGTDIANNGTINAVEVTAARDVLNGSNAVIQAGGGSATLALTIPATSGGDVNAARVREGAIRGLAPAFSITPSASAGPVLTVSAGRDINNGGLMTATTRLNLHADGAIFGAGRVVAPLLVVRGFTGGDTRAGSFDLTALTNAIEVLDARSNRLQTAASERLIFGQTNGFTVTQANAGNGNVTLRSDGAITRSTGVTTGVVGDLLTVRGAAGGNTRAARLDLTEGSVTTGNAIQRLDARTNSAAAVNTTQLTFGQATGFSVTQADAGSGNVTLRSGEAITRTAGVTTGVVANTLTLRGAGGGNERAGGVSLVDGTVTSGNAVTNLDARTTGNLVFGQDGAIIVAQLDTGTGNATLRSNGAMSNTGLVNTALLTVRGAAGGSTAAESLALTGANNISALDVLVRGALGLNLASGAQIQQLGSSAGSVQITANGALTVTGLVTAAQDMTLRATSGDVSIIQGGTLSGGRATTLTAAGNVVQTGGTLSAGTALTITAGQDVSITGGTTSAASLGTSAQGVSAGRDFVLSGGNVTLPTLHAVTAGGNLRLRTTGGATTATGSLTAGGNLAVETTAGALTMQGNTVRAGTGTLELRADGNLGVFGASLSSGQAMTLRATGSLTSNPSSFAADSISLVSGAGLSFTQANLTAAQGLTAEVTGDIAFQNSNLRASTNPADSTAAFRPLRLAATGNLTLRNSTVTADRVEFVAGGSITTAGSNFSLGTALLLSARGGVGQANEAATNVTPLNSNRLPLVIYDTRSGIFLTRLPDLLTNSTTDQPSRSFNAQTWQVPQVTTTPGQLLFGVNDGAVAPPTNAAAGAVLVNLNAPGLPVFMLLNGGTASGTITATRLGVYGLPGATLPDGRSVNLLGSLGGVAGESAARFGNLGGQQGTQPSPLALDLYRFNNCVLSSVNCVVPTFLQLPTIPLINSVVLGVQQPAFDDRDVLLPNVAEKDF